MTQPAKAQEPSMEEILASIRRIISDDDSTAKAAPPPPKPVAPPPAPPRAEAPRPAPVPAAPPKPAVMPPRERTVVPDAAATPVEPVKPVTNGAAPADLAEPDILDLTEDMAAEPPMPAPQPEPASSNFRTIDGQPDVFFAESPAEPEPVREPEPPARMPPRPAPALESFGFDDRSSTIISQATSAAVDSAFSQLAQSVFTQNGRTIEDLVREMMRPMLKAWLDDNLPGLVERLVRAEIERVSRGRS